MFYHKFFKILLNVSYTLWKLDVIFSVGFEKWLTRALCRPNTCNCAISLWSRCRNSERRTYILLSHFIAGKSWNGACTNLISSFVNLFPSFPLFLFTFVLNFLLNFYISTLSLYIFLPSSLVCLFLSFFCKLGGDCLTHRIFPLCSLCNYIVQLLENNSADVSTILIQPDKRNKRSRP